MAAPAPDGLRWARRAGGLTVAWEAVNPGGPPAHRTPSFAVSADRSRLSHRLTPEQIDNDLGDRIAAELVRPGLLADFEAAFAGVVACTAADPLDAWERFYRQTLAGLRDPGRSGDGAIATFGAIYRHALTLVRGASLLDAGSCFGFLCLLAAERGLEVRGSDLDGPTAALAAAMARRLERPVGFSRADCTVALPGGADTVSALHVLEHLTPDSTARALRVLCTAARRRVIVAVPLEADADPTYGHRTAFPGLAALAAAAEGLPGWRSDVHAHRGGWLVLDRR